MAEAPAPQHSAVFDPAGGIPAVAYATSLGPDPTPVPTPPLLTHGSVGRVEMVDAVRGIACLWVLMHHSYLYWVWRIRLPVLWHLNDAAKLGFLGVHMFLVISGFVLFFPVVRRLGVREVRVDNVAFFHRRTRRILPPYYAALVLFALLTLWPLYHESGSIFDFRSVFEHIRDGVQPGPLEHHDCSTGRSGRWQFGVPALPDVPAGAVGLSSIRDAADRAGGACGVGCLAVRDRAARDRVERHAAEQAAVADAGGVVRRRAGPVVRVRDGCRCWPRLSFNPARTKRRSPSS